MKKHLFIIPVLAMIALSSCTNTRNVSTKGSVAFPGMTVSRDDYTLSKNVSSSVQVKEFTTLFGFIHTTKIEGQDKKTVNQGNVKGYKLKPAAQIAAYKLLEENPSFDYLTNIKVKEVYTAKWMLFFTKYESKISMTAKGITLKADK